MIVDIRILLITFQWEILLILNTLGANSADDKLMTFFSYFSQKTGLAFQILFSEKKKKKKKRNLVDAVDFILI